MLGFDTGSGRRWFGGLALTVLPLLVLDGCVVAVRPPPTRAYVVTAPPPPPLPEERGPATSQNPSSVWVSGYWHWVGARYAWIPGHWEDPPPGSVGAHWASPQYGVANGSYTYEPGRWQ